MQYHVHTSTHIQIKYAHFYMNVYMSYPMSRILADSLIHAFAMYENCFQNKRFLFLKLIEQPSISKHIGQAADIKSVGKASNEICWTTLRYNLLDILRYNLLNILRYNLLDILRYNLLDNPPISKHIRQPFDIKHNGQPTDIIY